MNVKEQTKLNLKEAFWKVYKEKPLNKISIKEITDIAGYNRGTFYNYYKDVHDMFEEIKQSLMPPEEEIAVMLKTIKQKEWDKMIDVRDSSEDINQRDQILLLFGPNGDPNFIHEYKRDIRRKILRQVNDISTKDSLKLEYVLEFMLSGLLSVAMLWSENDENIPEEELDQVFYEIMESGLKEILVNILSD
ncbi:TetR/AcrR family transcriptional regulator [Corticicoccus populi]|uniref:TetR/AcrR family transcriptional regulator n=1 Tax=Corticicoccus populi TaxID=1812821 RepID=A0ABW5WXF3_9STAP